MSKKDRLFALYKEIFGDKIKCLNEENPIEMVKPADKCSKCITTTCPSYNNRQDLPYFKNLKKVETFVIAESPGSGKENGKLGFVFGWEQFGGSSKKKRILNYEHFLFKVLNLNPETTYITDAIKCYTPGKKFKDAFEYCKSYLKKEIQILKPSKVLIVSKQGELGSFIKQLKEENNFELKIIPHPSGQNFGKIKTVAELFKGIGDLVEDEKYFEEWTEVGEKIDFLYEQLKPN